MKFLRKGDVLGVDNMDIDMRIFLQLYTMFINIIVIHSPTKQSIRLKF